MPKGIVYWSNNELWVKWEITKANQIKWSKSTPVKDANIKRAMETFKNTTEEFKVDVELEKGTAGKIVFSEKEIENTVETEQKQREELYRQQEEKRRENEKREEENEEENEKMPRKPIDTKYSKDFHNPYNFIPAISREGVTGDLADGKPHGHDRFLPEMLSGKLTVKMMVETPLVALDAARVEIQNDHKRFPVRVGADGKPFINPTAVKGMLRSAYEAVTNSRMSVFTKHDERLAFRPEAGAFVVPVKIEEENNIKKIVFYTGTNKISDLKSNGSPQNGKPLCAAWLPRYERKGNYEITTYRDGSLPEHQDKVKVYIEKFEHHKWLWKPGKRPKGGFKGDGFHKQDFIFWRVRQIVSNDSELNSKPDFSEDKGERFSESYYKPLKEIVDAEGIVFVSNHNMQSKHDEKVFFQNPDSPQSEILKIEKWNRLEKAWKELIENYRTQHEKVKGKLDPVSESLRIDEWSRHIQLSEKEKTLKPGMLCFAEVEKSGTELKVKRLFPVMISRQLFEKSPAELLDKTLKPATDIDELSPADRVFGCVIQNSGGKKKVNAYRGQIRIGAVSLSEESAKKPIDQIIHKFEGTRPQSKWLPMNILGQPKPQQGRFYVAEDKYGNAQTEQGTNEESGYNAGSGLRGRKVYPHHANLPVNYWFEEKDIDFSDRNKLESGNQYREYLRPPNGEKQRNNQNRSIEGWIKPQTEFEFDIHFTNLSKVELGALIWLLQLPKNHFHRFGGGKPLGFGSVQLEISKYHIKNGSELANFYKSLDSELTETVRLNENAEEFEKRLEGTFIKPFTDEIEKAKYQKIIKSFLSACKGFAGKPTHYPRTKPMPNAEGKSFEWFVDNAKKEGRKLSLPDLEKEIGLPLNPKDENRNNFGGNRR